GGPERAGRVELTLPGRPDLEVVTGPDRLGGPVLQVDAHVLGRLESRAALELLRETAMKRTAVRLRHGRLRSTPDPAVHHLPPHPSRGAYSRAARTRRLTRKGFRSFHRAAISAISSGSQNHRSCSKSGLSSLCSAAPA